MRRALVAVCAALLSPGCSTRDIGVTAKDAEAGVIAAYLHGDYTNLYERCNDGDRLYILVGAKGNAIAVVPGGCVQPAKSEIR